MSAQVGKLCLTDLTALGQNISLLFLVSLCFFFFLFFVLVSCCFFHSNDLYRFKSIFLWVFQGSNNSSTMNRMDSPGCKMRGKYSLTSSISARWQSYICFNLQLIR